MAGGGERRSSEMEREKERLGLGCVWGPHRAARETGRVRPIWGPPVRGHQPRSAPRLPLPSVRQPPDSLIPSLSTEAQP